LCSFGAEEDGVDLALKKPNHLPKWKKGNCRATELQARKNGALNAGRTALDAKARVKDRREDVTPQSNDADQSCLVFAFISGVPLIRNNYII